jgi:hypothetical protein
LLSVAGSANTTAINTVNQYIMQARQYETQLANLKKMAQVPGSLQDAKNSLRTLQTYRGSLEKLSGSLESEKKAFDTRLTEAKLSNMSWNDYMSKVLTDAQNGNKKAQARLTYESGLIEQVNSDYAFAREAQSKIQETEGLHQSLQLLNSQMNRVVLQNGKLLEVIAQTQVKDSANTQAERAIQQQESLTMRNYQKSREEAIRERNKAFGGLN